MLAELRPEHATGHVFPGAAEGKPFIGFPRAWTWIFKKSDLADLTAHVLRHSFASTANDRGFTEATIAAMLGHSRGTITSRYVHSVDVVLVAAADAVAAHILDSMQCKEPAVIENSVARTERDEGYSIAAE
jgi:integrase